MMSEALFYSEFSLFCYLGSRKLQLEQQFLHGLKCLVVCLRALCSGLLCLSVIQMTCLTLYHHFYFFMQTMQKYVSKYNVMKIWRSCSLIYTDSVIGQ